jgi:Arabinose-binding domain of AraC transcription regulator, N-term
LRVSEPPGWSSTLRSISNGANERPIVGLNERIHESTKLAALFDMLVEQDCPADEILRNVNLTVDEVHSPKSRISLAELMAACKNAIGLSNDPHLPYRIGTSIHISAYRIYGFAILCPDFRKAWHLPNFITHSRRRWLQSNSPRNGGPQAGSLNPMRAP